MDLFRPLVASDIVVFSGPPASEHERVLLITRKNPPYEGHHAFPGGLLDEGEDCEQCAARELQEETAVVGVELSLLGVWSTPGRDPRGAVISIVYTGRVDEEGARTARAGDDAASLAWHPVASIDLGRLAFDHAEMLARAKAFWSI